MRHMNAFRKGNSQREFHQRFASQSAMEYLMTYGWAILIIAVVLAALFELGVFNPMTFAPKAPPGSCQVVRPEGAGTTDFISLSGECNGELPQYVARLGNSPAYILIAKDQYIPSAGSGSRTISLWFNSLAPGSSGTVFTQPRTGQPNLDVCGSFNLGAEDLGGNRIVFGLHKCTNDIWTYSPRALYGVWNYVAVSYNNLSDTVTFYINDNTTGPITNIGMFPSNGNFTIGGWDDYWATLSGYVSNVQIYNTALSTNEIQALYQEGIGGAPIKIQNLAGWWPLNGNANDYSGNGNNGVPNGITYTSNWYSGYSAP